VATIFRRLPVPKTLATEFLGVFSRFEYALKAAGFVRGDHKRVEADWDTFARQIAPKFKRTRNPQLDVAVKYLLTQPPRRQVIVNKRVAWRDSPPDANVSESERVLLMVRRVRNNLFHGAKYWSPENGRRARDRLLVAHSLTVLKVCVSLNEEVTIMYEHGAFF